MAGQTLGAGAPQCMQALALANRIRMRRSALKQMVASGRVNVADVVLNPSEDVLTMAVLDLLTAQRLWGRTRVRRFYSEHDLRISDARTLGALTDRERDIIAAALSDA